MGVVKEIDDGRMAMKEIRKEKERAFNEPCHEEASQLVDQRVLCENGNLYCIGRANVVNRF